MSEKEPTTEELVAVYVKMRNAIEARQKEQEAEMAILKEGFDAIASRLLTICNEQNADSIKTGAGTVSRRVTSRYWTSDWESMHKFILSHEAPFLLEQRIHNGNMKQFLEDNPEDFPMGLQADKKYTIQVRKPTNK